MDAADDFEGIYSYLSVTHPQLVERTILHIYRELKGLGRFPFLGRPAIKPGLREFFLWPLPYVCTYKVEESAVHLLRIHHTAQDRYGSGWDDV